MNWEAIGAMGEVLGAAGVIVTLAYLATQLRQNTLALRGTMHDAASAQLREVESMIIGDPELTRLWTVGLEHPDQLEPLERSRLIHMMFMVLGAFENFHFQYRIGSLEEGKWLAWQAILSDYIAAPALASYWEQRKSFFAPEFRELVDGLPRGDGVRVRHLTGEDDGQDP